MKHRIENAVYHDGYEFRMNIFNFQLFPCAAAYAASSL